jgi:hypothetical protein
LAATLISFSAVGSYLASLSSTSSGSCTVSEAFCSSSALAYSSSFYILNQKSLCKKKKNKPRLKKNRRPQKLCKNLKRSKIRKPNKIQLLKMRLEWQPKVKLRITLAMLSAF